MADSLLDPEAIRARVERRLAPRMRLLWRRAWLFAHLALFAIAMYLIYADAHTSIFYFSTSYTVPGYTVPNPAGTMITIPSQTFQMRQPYPVVSLLSWVWLLLLIFHGLTVWMAFARERTVQRELERELELEKMKLQLELARLNHSSMMDSAPEKPKRVTGLADDGELVLEDAPASQRTVQQHP